VNDEGDIQRDLMALEAELRRLEAEYNMFFAGRLPRPPWETRSRVAALVKRWDRGHIQGSANKFRFATLQARFQSFVDLWDRALRAKEEGRTGPLVTRAGEASTAAKAKEKEQEKPDKHVVHQTSFTDPMREMDKLHSLYERVMDARRSGGGDVVPFHKFAALVQDQVKKLRETGNREVSFKVTEKDGKVSLSAKGSKAAKPRKK
jgi:hypothetical protein